MIKSQEQNIIISTRHSEPEHFELAAKNGFHLQDVPMIEIDLAPPLDILQQTTDFLKSSENPAIVFTSKNAVSAISDLPDLLKIIQKFPVFAVGEKTAEKLQKQVSKNVTIADGNASSLADMLQKNCFTKILHFCGSMRREELENKLLDSGATYKDIIVYKTKLISKIPRKIPNKADFIFFMSPSAAQAFFRLGLLHVYPEAIYVAIGQTTLAELLPHPVSSRVARKPDFASMLHECR